MHRAAVEIAAEPAAELVNLLARAIDCAKRLLRNGKAEFSISGRLDLDVSGQSFCIRSPKRDDNGAATADLHCEPFSDVHNRTLYLHRLDPAVVSGQVERYGRLVDSDPSSHHETTAREGFLISLALLAQIVAAGQTFICTPTRVWDGDGPIWCAEGPRIRLAGVAAREIDGTCRPGQPCPRGSGVKARDRLARLLGGFTGRSRDGHGLVHGPVLRCRSTGWGKGVRTAAWCSAPTIGDLSCALVRAKVVLRWKRYGGDQVCGLSAR